MNRGKGRNRQENNHSETREGKERETKGNTEKCGKIRRSAEKYNVRKRWKSAEMTLGKIIVKVKCHVMSHEVLRYITACSSTLKSITYIQFVFFNRNHTGKLVYLLSLPHISVTPTFTFI